jgi:hypothetical protein
MGPQASPAKRCHDRVTANASTATSAAALSPQAGNVVRNGLRGDTELLGDRRLPPAFLDQRRDLFTSR